MRSFDQLTHILTDIGSLSMLREEAAADLAELGNPNAIPLLIAALEDPSAFVRREVAWALGKLNATEATAPLLLALAHEANDETRRSLIEILGQIGTHEAIPALAAMSGSKSLLTRVEAQKSIRRILMRHPPVLEPDADADESTTPSRTIRHNRSYVSKAISTMHSLNAN